MKQAQMKKTRKQFWTMVPTELKEDFKEINFKNDNHKNKALKFINLLQKEGFQDNYDLLKFRYKPAKWFKKLFQGDYYKEFLGMLTEHEILEVNHYYSKDKKQSKTYRINHKYYCKDSIHYSSVSYTDHNSISNEDILLYNYHDINSYLPYMRTDLDKLDLKTFRIDIYSISKQVIYSMIDDLKINYTAIINKTEEVVSSINSAMFKVDSEIMESYFEVYNRVTKSKQWTTKKGAMAYVQKAGLSLIQDKDKFYIDDLDRYVETKKKNILASYTLTTKSLQKRIYNINRNETNIRLDTIFTSMCSYTLDIIKEDNNLIEIDLVNSQFAILANWLMNEACYVNDDVKLFCKLAVEGGLYEYMATHFGITRKEAKSTMMSVSFSSYRSSSEMKKKFAKLFPNVYGFIQGFKKEATKNMEEDNSSAFAIQLQKIESRHFICNLLKRIIDKGLFVLTKHDSLIIKEENKPEVLDIVKNYFKTINYQITIKVGDKVIHNGHVDIQIQDETIPAADNTRKETGGDNEDKNLIYAERCNQIKERYMRFQKIDRKLDRDSIIGLQIMSDKYKPAKELLELIRA